MIRMKSGKKVQKPKGHSCSRVWGRVTSAPLSSYDTGLEPAEQAGVTVSWLCPSRRKSQPFINVTHE